MARAWSSAAMADHPGNAAAARPDLDKAASGVLADDTVHAIELATQASESKVSTGRVRAGNDADAEGDALKMHAASHGHAHKPPFKFHAILNTRPLRAQCIGCGALCCSVLLLVIAVVLGGTSVVNFTTDGACWRCGAGVVGHHFLTTPPRGACSANVPTRPRSTRAGRRGCRGQEDCQRRGWCVGSALLPSA